MEDIFNCGVDTISIKFLNEVIADVVTVFVTAKEINEMLGVKSNGGGMWSIYTGKNVCKQLPTEELWGKLQKILTCNRRVIFLKNMHSVR